LTNTKKSDRLNKKPAWILGLRDFGQGGV